MIKENADENIIYGIVLVLRLQGINIKHACEVNMANRDDQDHFQYAKRTDRDFLNHSVFPFEQIKGKFPLYVAVLVVIAVLIIAWIILKKKKRR